MLKKIKSIGTSVMLKASKISARVMGCVIASLSTMIVAYADNEGTAGAWSSLVNWVNNNRAGLETLTKALIGLCLVAAVICIAVGGSQGLSKVKNWLIGIGIAVAILVFGQAFLDSLYTA